jgi:hypothetical protein
LKFEYISESLDDLKDLIKTNNKQKDK